MFVTIVQLIFKVIFLGVGINSVSKMKSGKKLYWDDYWAAYLTGALTIIICSF